MMDMCYHFSGYRYQFKGRRRGGGGVDPKAKEEEIRTRHVIGLAGERRAVERHNSSHKDHFLLNTLY